MVRTYFRSRVGDTCGPQFLHFRSGGAGYQHKYAPGGAGFEQHKREEAEMVSDEEEVDVS